MPATPIGETMLKEDFFGVSFFTSTIKSPKDRSSLRMDELGSVFMSLTNPELDSNFDWRKALSRILLVPVRVAMVPLVKRRMAEDAFPVTIEAFGPRLSTTTC